MYRKPDWTTGGLKRLDENMATVAELHCTAIYTASGLMLTTALIKDVGPTYMISGAPFSLKPEQTSAAAAAAAAAADR